MKYQHIISRPAILVLAFTGLLTFCGKDEQPEPGKIEEKPVETLAWDLSSSSLFFHHKAGSRDFYLKNTGSVAFEWAIRPETNRLRIEDAEGELASGDSTRIVVHALRDELPDSTYHERLIIEIDQQNIRHEMPVSLVQYTAAEQLWNLNLDIVDAAYNKAGDNIIVLSRDGKLHKLMPTDRTIVTLDLEMSPVCISVRPDKQEAVVGHPGALSYVDLQNMVLKAHYGFPVKVFDLVMGMNGFAYMFPAEGSWTNIYSIRLATGQTTHSYGGSIHQNTYGRLHPSGSYLYGANTGLSPSDFEKYRIDEDKAELMYDSPYHGDYPFNGGIWISETGDYLFARSRHIFTSSPHQENDMRHAGELEGSGEVQALDNSAGAGRTYAIFRGHSWYYEEGLSSEVYCYDKDFHLLEKIKLPWIMSGAATESERLSRFQGQYCFFNSAGSELFVLGKGYSADQTQKAGWVLSILPVR